MKTFLWDGHNEKFILHDFTWEIILENIIIEGKKYYINSYGLFFRQEDGTWYWGSDEKMVFSKEACNLLEKAYKYYTREEKLKRILDLE